MQPVHGLPVNHRAPGGSPKVYEPKFRQLIGGVDTGFFDAADTYVEVARFGGASTAAQTASGMRNGRIELPTPPEGWLFVVDHRRLAEGGSALYARLSTIEALNADADVDADVDIDDLDDPDEAAWYYDPEVAAQEAVDEGLLDIDDADATEG
jgi:hypothetical protein